MDGNKLKSIRAGHRSAVTRLFRKTEECKEKSENDIEELTALLETLMEKKKVISGLNEDILSATEDGNIEQEITEADEYQLNFETKLRHFRKFVQSLSNTTNQSCTQISAPLSEVDAINQTSSSMPNLSMYHSTSSTTSQNHRLPKLTLPTFNGDILKWQTFWDSFDSAVHSNINLTDVQKFSYLKAQLINEAAQTISGLALTNANYHEAINLLKGRFGKSHKITNAYMQALLDLPTPKNTLSNLRAYYDNLESYIRGLDSLGQSSDSFGALLVPVILSKLPAEIRKHLAREHGNDNWHLNDLRHGILKEIEIMEAGQITEYGNPYAPASTASFLTQTKPKKKEKPIYRENVDRSIKTKPCVYCYDLHDPAKCMKVVEFDRRMSIVKHKKLCFNCLGNHLSKNCQSQSRCRQCHKKHHTSLCNTRPLSSTVSSEIASNRIAVSYPVSNGNETNSAELPNSNVASLHSSIAQSRGNILLKTAVAPVWSDFQSIDSNILLDEGAQKSFITENLADKLNLKPCGVEAIQLSSFGNANKDVRYLSKVTVHIETESGDKIPLDVLVVPMIAMPLQNNIRRSISNLRHLNGLKLAHPVSEDDTFEIELLIGADYYWDIVEDEIIRGDGPTAVKSKLGYLLSGPSYINANRSSGANIFNIVTQHQQEEFQLESFWKLESLGIDSKEVQNEKSDYLEEYQKNSIEFREGKYVAKLPWKPDHGPLPTNLNIAKKRTERVIRRLEQEPEMLQKYGEIIAEQERRGFIEKVNSENGIPDKVHYIPHHPVKKDSVTTPIRIVYDCSCRQSAQHHSLNDCLMDTPPILNDLTKLLVRFRLKKFAVSTDIEKAFLHVSLNEEDRDVTRFFWLSDPANPNSPLSTYRFKAVLFGATCSPFILSATILKHLEMSGKNVAHILKNDIYVDNILSSLPEENDVISYYKDARQLMSSGGFNLRSWTSNSQKLRELAASENVLDNEREVKLLGMRWNVESDCILYPKYVIPVSEPMKFTKREVLKQTSRIYDPLGLLSPVSVRAKLLIQQLWKQRIGWDEVLSPETQIIWREIAGDLESATSVELPRCYFTTQNTAGKNTLHVFVDASIKAYGATAYLCNNHKESAIVMAKTRIAPLKQLTLPQLELMAALIGARLANHLESTIDCEETVFWTDSQIVLCWLNSSKTLKRFIRNRVDEICDLTKVKAWRYCPTNHNPADLLTRGITVDQFKHSNLWIKGPEWLLDPAKWPEWNISDVKIMSAIVDGSDDDMDTRQTIVDINGIDKVIDISRFSCFRKIIRVTSYVQRFIANCLQATRNRISGPITSNELQNSTNKWIRSCQESTYQTELEYLKLQSKTSVCPSRVRQLKLFIDESGILRCGGRLHNAPISDSAKFPILLPANHELTSLIVRDAHVTHLHSGVNSTIVHLRQVFWIPSIRPCVKKIIRKCVVCRKVNGKPYVAPTPPPLPKVRLQESAPFSVTGVDFTGALHVKDRARNVSKAYICLFSCASTRAVHLEVVTDLSAETFLQAFRRFASRKSRPRIVISDNASTFYAASDSLKQMLESPSLKEEFANRGVEWRFIPKRAPWYGGWWERLIGLTKTSMKKVIGKSFIDLDSLNTLLTEIEAVLNDRPLTYVSSEVGDCEALTPSHLLYGRRISTIPYPHVEIDDIDDPSYDEHGKLSKRVSHQTQTMQHFWKRWKYEYLTSLREFHNFNGNDDQNIKVGDVVQVHDDSPRVKWKLAVIMELIKGNDDLIRAVKIRTADGVTSRPITKLYPLEISHEVTEEIDDVKLGNSIDSTEHIRTKRKASERARVLIRKCLDSDSNDSNL